MNLNENIENIYFKNSNNFIKLRINIIFIYE